MLNWKNFRNTVASVICTLDCIEQCDWVVLVDTMMNAEVTSAGAVEVLQTMERKGLIVFDREPEGKSQIVAITNKGRLLAGDIRHVTLGRIQ